MVSGGHGRFQVPGRHHLPWSGSLSPLFPPQEVLIRVPHPPHTPRLPELRANCFFMPWGVFSPKFFVAVAMATKNPAALYFPGIQDGVGVWDGETTRLVQQGPFYPIPPPSFGPPPHPHRAWSSLGPQRPGCLSGWVAGLRFPRVPSSV